MTLSPQERAKVLELVAKVIVEELRHVCGGDLEELVVLPLSAAACHVGLSARQTAAVLPVTKTAKGKHGVTLANIRRHIAATTSYPRDWPGIHLLPERHENETDTETGPEAGHPPTRATKAGIA